MVESVRASDMMSASMSTAFFSTSRFVGPFTEFRMAPLTARAQIILYLLAMIANPITIHTFVVFVRLYWFEKRFQHVVKQSMELRKSRTKSQMRVPQEKDPSDLERGVAGRNIVVLRDSGKPMGPGMGSLVNEKNKMTDAAEVGGSSSSSSAQKGASNSSAQSQVGPLPTIDAPTFHRNITFADEVTSPETTSQPVPDQLSPDRHIAFLENQRNPKDTGTLRIPGPRESDLGQNPETVNEDEADGDDNIGRSTTLDDSDRSGPLRVPAQLFNKLTNRRAGTMHSQVSGTDDARSGRSRLATILSSGRSTSREPEPIPYLSWQPTIGRNSAFIDLTEEQREELGGVEYRSLKTLAVVLVAYFVLFHLLGVIVFLPWIIRTDPWGSLVDSESISRVWWGIFTPATLFNDLGFTLTPDSMISFQSAVMPLLLGSYLIIIGNTGFPCMLRFVIWALSKITESETPFHEELRFLLDHPRRCFTLLFPSQATWILFGILVALNGIDLIFFIILDLNDPYVTSIPGGLRFLNGLFQAASTRTAGTAVVNLSLLHPAIQVSYLIMMYISVFPIAISVRRTNVYEEKSLGIYGRPEDDEEDGKEPSYIGAHLRKQLQFDLWFIFLGLFIIAIAEGGRIQAEDSEAFSLFPCLFEIVSAYGTVGLSLGYTDINASFSAEFSVISKLVITAMMLRGRHRGLPYQLDRAILLPNEGKQRREDEDAARRVLVRRNSSISHLHTLRTHASRSTFASGRDDSGGGAQGMTGRPGSVRSPDTPAAARPHPQSWPVNSPHLRPPDPRHGVGHAMAGLAAVGPGFRSPDSRASRAPSDEAHES